MKYGLRFVWYITRVVLISVTVFSLLLVAFFVAKDSGNVYIIVTEGLKTRAEVVLQDKNPTELSAFFVPELISGDTLLYSNAYDGVKVTDFTYHLTIKSIWCYPWQGAARVTVEESIPIISVMDVTTYDDTTGAAQVFSPAVPAWTRARYTLELHNINSKWYITSMVQTQVLEPEPTPSPDPGQTPAPARTTSSPAMPSPGNGS